MNSTDISNDWFGLKPAIKAIVPEQVRYKMRRVQQLANVPFLRSDRGVYCNCCHGTFKTFLDFYGSSHLRCPYCNSLPRQRLEVELLEKLLPKLHTVRLLHFAPEYSLSKYFADKPLDQYVKVDYLVSFIPGICVLPDRKEDIRQLSFDDGTFSMVLCNHVLEHIEEDQQAISELHRVLDEDGIGIVTVPISTTSHSTLEDPSIVSPEDKMARYGSPDHVRMYGMDIAERLENAGFTVTAVKAEHLVSDEITSRMVLDKEECVFVLSKSEAGTTKIHMVKNEALTV